jgi:hypothetical protein
LAKGNQLMASGLESVVRFEATAEQRVIFEEGFPSHPPPDPPHRMEIGCPASAVVTGGGYWEVDGPTEEFRENGPEGNTWVVQFQAQDGDQHLFKMRAFALCAVPRQ